MTCLEMMTLLEEIKAAVSFVMNGVAKEHAQDGPRSEFMWSSGG